MWYLTLGGAGEYKSAWRRRVNCQLVVNLIRRIHNHCVGIHTSQCRKMTIDDEGEGEAQSYPSAQPYLHNS